MLGHRTSTLRGSLEITEFRPFYSPLRKLKPKKLVELSDIIKPARPRDGTRTWDPGPGDPKLLNF